MRISAEGALQAGEQVDTQALDFNAVSPLCGALKPRGAEITRVLQGSATACFLYDQHI